MIADGWVYFIQAGDAGPIKIGFTSGSVQKRAAALATGNPVQLRILGKTQGSVETEARLHARFAKHRLNGEWFAPAPELLWFIEGATFGQSRSESIGGELHSVGPDLDKAVNFALSAYGLSAEEDLYRITDLVNSGELGLPSDVVCSLVHLVGTAALVNDTQGGIACLMAQLSLLLYLADPSIPALGMDKIGLAAIAAGVLQMLEEAAGGQRK